MTEVHDTTDRKAKWLRNTGRALAKIWAASWTLSLLAFALVSFYMLAATFPHTIPPDWWIALPLLVLPSWIAANALPRRSERVGGVVLVVMGFLLLILNAWMYLHPAQGFVLVQAPLWLLTEVLELPFLVGWFPFLLLAGFPLVPGTLLLASWWKSRTPAPSPATD